MSEDDHRFRLHWHNIRSYGGDVTEHDKNIDRLLHEDGFFGINLVSVTNYEKRLIKHQMKKCNGAYYWEDEIFYDSDIGCSNISLSIIIEKEEDRDMIVDFLSSIPERTYLCKLSTDLNQQNKKLKSMTNRGMNFILFIGKGDHNYLSCDDKDLAIRMKLLFC